MKEQINNQEEKMSHDELVEMINKSFTNYKKGDLIEGTVVRITDHEVLVDIGTKTEGVIPISEFLKEKLPEKDSKISAVITQAEEGEGRLKLSKKRADFLVNIEKLKSALESGEIITGTLLHRIKGGMIVDIFGLEAFLPGSQISIKPIPNLDQFFGKESKFKIIKIDEERRNIVVSRKKVLEQELSERKAFLKEKIQVNAELDGEVKNITDYGAFIDLGGIDGLLHITDMSWGHLKHPSEILNIGDRLKVKVISCEDEGRVSLGIKQLVPHPWENIEIKYTEGSKVTGKIVNLTPYGAFVELEPGVEGLIHVSEMSWTKKIIHPNNILKEGDTISAIVLNISKEEKRISLGLKQMEPDPWLAIDERYPEGKIIKRKIKNITKFGIFVEIEKDIDGLIHVSDISWTKRVYHPKEMYTLGEEIESVVLSIDKPLHRIALGVKQLHKDPWDDLDQRIPVNTEITNAKVCKLISKGVLVDIFIDDYKVEGFVPISHLAITGLEKTQDAFLIGDEIPLKVIELDMENRRLILSAKAYFFGKEKEVREEYQDFYNDRIIERKEKIANGEIIEEENGETKKKKRKKRRKKKKIDNNTSEENEDVNEEKVQITEEETTETTQISEEKEIIEEEKEEENNSK